MKRAFQIVCTGIFILLIPVSHINGQERKIEKKIKIIVDDGSERKIVIDTLLSNSSQNDSILLKDGSVVYFNDSGSESGLRDQKGKDHFTVSYSSNGNNKGKEFKEITVLSSDSSEVNDSSNTATVNYTRSESHEGHGTVKYKITSMKSNGDGDNIEIYSIDKNEAPGGENNNSIYVTDSGTNKESTTATKYVIAKDGIVVTVEGNDEARAKELVKEIKAKMGIVSESSQNKEKVKPESKK
jgi:hypothetical protein